MFFGTLFVDESDAESDDESDDNNNNSAKYHTSEHTIVPWTVIFVR